MDRPVIVLHSSPLRLALSACTPLLLGWLGWIGLGGGAPAVGTVFTAFALLTGAVVLLDLPLRAELSEQGVLRVCALRRQHLPWGEVVALERTRARPSRRAADPDRARGPRPNQGLVARTARRRVYLLVDRRESYNEWADVRDLLADRATVLRADEPPIDARPAGRRSASR